MNKTFVKACMDFFGKLPGQTSLQFMEEIKSLDSDDRAYFAREFAKIGITITSAVA